MPKILSITFVLFFITYHCSVAQENEAKTLLGKQGDISVKDLGLFISPAIGITQFDGASASLLQLRGGINIKDKISIGAYFNTSLNQVVPVSETVPGIYMDYQTAGGFVEYTLFSKKMVHFSFPLSIGWGEVQMDRENGPSDLGEANFLQVEPAALLELNLQKHVRFHIGASYRFVSKVNYRNFTEAELSGLNAFAGLRIGLFR